MSTSADAGPSGNPATGTSGTGTVPTGDPTLTPTTSGSGGTTDVIINEKPFTSDSAWPKDLILDRTKSNWEEWDRRLNLVVDQRLYSLYLDGTFPCPDLAIHPKAALNWRLNDRALRGFILEHVSNVEYGIASRSALAHDVYTVLRKSQENLGPHAQVHLMKKALDTRISLAPPLNIGQTLDEIDRLHDRFTKMGKMDDDKFKMLLYINCLDPLPQLQSSVNEMLRSSATISSSDIKDRVLHEEQLLQRREHLGIPLTSGLGESTALTTTTNKPRPVCANCKRNNHRTEFCIAPGGQMAGKSIDEAHNAQRTGRQQSHGTHITATQNTSTPQQPGTPTTGTAKNDNTMTINGKCYMLVSDSNAPSSDATILTAIPEMSDYDQEEYFAMVAATEVPQASVNWGTSTQPAKSPCETSLAYPTGRCEITRAAELPFILDTGATCHISPEASDFKTLRHIPRHPVKGLAGSAVYAIGVGDIKLHIASGHKLKLTNVLYIPESSVRLISILALNRSGDYTTHFDSMNCWVTNKSNTVLVRGSISPTKRLYTLSTKTPSVHHKKGSNPPSALYVRVPNVETWHRRLGHCNTRTIIEMAKNGTSEGMPIDLSALPPRCDHCALGKQSRSPVPQTREGNKAEKRLERVFVDLCGPMAVTSRSGNVYSMNLIDDFSSYVWSVPLRSKSEACEPIQTWHKAVATQTGDKLRILVTDNGELVSSNVRDWCNAEGIDHQLTAPYTSAHNGRAERLHRTLLGKARAMRMACNAPAFLWDEFCATAAYLTTLTAATANNGKTPYELWFGRKP